MTTLPLDRIRTDGGTQPRAHLNPDTVAEYAAAMEEDGVVFPPVTVFYDGADYWLADGFHRVAASVEAGFADIDADIRQGARRDAVLFSVGANADHGLRRTNEDKRRAVMTLLNDEEWSRLSDSDIARHCGVSHPFVGSLRSKASCNGFKIADQPTTRTVTRNGKTYQQRTGNRGKGKGKKKPAPTPAEPAPEPVDIASTSAVRVLNALDRLMSAIEQWPDPADALPHLTEYAAFREKLPVVGSWLARLQELEEARSASGHLTGASSLCLN